MPILPENKHRYGPAFKLLSVWIRRLRCRSFFQYDDGTWSASYERCECKGECGIDHTLEQVYAWPDTSADERCDALNGWRHAVTDSKVVLTVAHLDHTPENNHPANLKAMCQRCHNNYDRDHRRETRRARRAIGDLFDGT